MQEEVCIQMRTSDWIQWCRKEKERKPGREVILIHVMLMMTMMITRRQ